MKIKASRRVQTLPEYAFKQIDDRIEALIADGIQPVNFGVGDPATPTPKRVREECKRALDDRATSGYPSYIGAKEFLAAVATWTDRRFGVKLNPSTEITSTIGSKEGIFNFHEAFVNPGDLVLVPSPGYPPYSRGTWFAEGECFFYPLDEENGFLPDLAAIPSEVAKQAKIIWVNYPNSPTGVCPKMAFFESLYAWCRDNEIILASDEAYSEFYFGNAPPPTALQAGRDGVVVFNSLSKRSAMTCYRSGWAAGDREIIGILRKAKTNMDSGTPTFIQDASIAALEDESHVIEARDEYRAKRDVMVRALCAMGLEKSQPEGTLYIWQKVPLEMTSMDFATQLTRPELAIVCMPGPLISDALRDGRNPGEGYVRFALTPTMEEIQSAAARLKDF